MSEPAPQQNTTPSSATPLDDIMVAMDVVDTLRHDKRLVEQELNADARRAELIKRLREIYQAQGIEVTDEILQEGVRALEEERFIYTPPKNGLAVSFAKIYVARMVWGKFLLAGFAGIVTLWSVWHFAIEKPRYAEAERLPANLKTMVQTIKMETLEPDVVNTAQKLSDDGLRAIGNGETERAYDAERKLEKMLGDLRLEYRVLIVNRPNEKSIVWRIPDINETAKNYYVIVEALDQNGQAIKQSIISEETGKTKDVKSWGIRISGTVFEAIRADKQDDGIIQKNLVAEKLKGHLKLNWKIETSGAAITEW